MATAIKTTVSSTTNLEPRTTEPNPEPGTWNLEPDLRMTRALLRVAFGVFAPYLARHDRANHDIEDRNEDDRQERRREHAARDGRADGIACRRTRPCGQRQRQHAENEG